MFTTFSLLKSQPLTASEKREFEKLLRYYAATNEGAWLKDLPPSAYEIRWCPAMIKSGGVMGAFVPWLGKKVFLLPSTSQPTMPMRDPWPGLIAPTLVHELRHAWQYKRRPWLYILCCLPVLREFTLERDAWRKTQPAQKYFDTLEQHRAAAEFAQRSPQRPSPAPASDKSDKSDPSNSRAAGAE